jgi:hypothetical protein
MLSPVSFRSLTHYCIPIGLSEDALRPVGHQSKVPIGQPGAPPLAGRFGDEGRDPMVGMREYYDSGIHFVALSYCIVTDAIY